MDKKDWITFLLAIGIVIGMAIIVNLSKPEDSKTTPSVNIQTAGVDDICIGGCCSPKVHYKYNATPQTGPLRIYYNYDLEEIYSPGATGYPRLNFPENMKNPSGDLTSPDRNIYEKSPASIYGSSDIFSAEIWESENITTFAYMEESNSGFSRIFGVPYPVWRIRVSMVPKGNPAYSSLMWILIDSSTGDVITGSSVLPGNKISKEVEISNRNLYFLIEAKNVNSFKIILETPEISYDEAHINPKISDLINFLNTMKN